ncbi:MAG: M23 family metallopeptidase [Nocardioidaceae bacterium]
MGGLVSPATLLGAAVLVLSAAGAVTAAPTTSPALASGGVRASVLPGTIGTGAASRTTLDRREQAVSRDSQRDARAHAADHRLQAVTEQQAKERNAALAQLAASAHKQAGVIARDSWHLPVTPGVYHLTSRFGDCSSLWSQCHTGLDFAAPEGTPIHAVANGTVTDAGYAGSYGNRTETTLADGSVLWYAHQSEIGVKVGQRVVAGQVIGLVGSTGNTTGPHVHLEVRPGGGDPVDPFAALVAHGLKP